MRYPSFVLPTICSLLACSLACAQDPNEMNQRFENLRAIKQFGRSMDAPTMRDTLFAPMPYEVMAYSKVPRKARSDFEKGNAAMQRGEYGKAKAQYESAIAEYSDFALASFSDLDRQITASAISWFFFLRLQKRPRIAH